MSAAGGTDDVLHLDASFNKPCEININQSTVGMSDVMSIQLRPNEVIPSSAAEYSSSTDQVSDILFSSIVTMVFTISTSKDFGSLLSSKKKMVRHQQKLL